ncbi:MAG: Ger(x)C family spore germination protein [Tumebacillaceae bacterium]
MKRVLAVLLSTVLLTGCSTIQRKPLEALGVISAMGFDQEAEDKILGTVVLPNFTETGKEKIDVLTGAAHTTKELRFNLSRMSERQLVSGQIRVVVYGEELAKKGILQLSDTMFRDAEIGSQIHLAVCEGRAVDIYNHRFPDKPSIDIYLYKMIRKEMEQNSIPKSNLHLFLRHVYDKGGDAVLPYLKLGKEDVIVDGLALFYDDVYVGRINHDEARMLSYLMGGPSAGEIDTTVPGETSHGVQAHAVMMYLNMKRTIEAATTNGAPNFKIKLDIEGAVTEYTGAANLEEPPEVTKLEQAIQAEMKHRMQNLIDKLQQGYHVDPLGLGEVYRSKGLIQKLDRKAWKDLYKKAKIDVDVKVRILQTGMIH